MELIQVSINSCRIRIHCSKITGFGKTTASGDFEEMGAVIMELADL